MKNIPYGLHWIVDEDVSAAVAILKGDWITQGSTIDQFEKEVAAYVDSRYAVAFNSGTSALHGAMYAAGVSKGNEVITSPITFVATANAALYLGARPVFVDIDLTTYCIDITRVRDAVTEETKVIAPNYPLSRYTVSPFSDRLIWLS